MSFLSILGLVMIALAVLLVVFSIGRRRPAAPRESDPELPLPSPDAVDLLARLVQLHRRRVINDREFAAEKQNITDEG